MVDHDVYVHIRGTAATVPGFKQYKPQLMALILDPQSSLPMGGFNWIARITTEGAYIRCSDLMNS